MASVPPLIGPQPVGLRKKEETLLGPSGPFVFVKDLKGQNPKKVYQSN